MNERANVRRSTLRAESEMLRVIFNMALRWREEGKEDVRAGLILDEILRMRKELIDSKLSKL